MVSQNSLLAGSPIKTSYALGPMVVPKGATREMLLDNWISRCINQTCGFHDIGFPRPSTRGTEWRKALSVNYSWKPRSVCGWQRLNVDSVGRRAQLGDGGNSCSVL